MLEFENQMFLDIMAEDGLLIVAKGLGLESVFESLLKVYSDPGNLVLVTGTTDREEEYFISKLSSDNSRHRLVKITSDIGTAERRNVYLNGGVCFVTTRILTVDLLTDRLPVDSVTGILVYRAHKTIESCQESFILRLYRQKNKTGFIKAFSASPVSFKSGFSIVERVMRHLFLKKLYLWPRFHSNVVDCFDGKDPVVIELHVSMTPAMLKLQEAVYDLIRYSLTELKRLNPTIPEIDELTVENAMSKSFHKILQRNLDPIWHQLSAKTKSLVSDLKVLRTIILFLTQYDSVTFLSFVSALRTTENAFKCGGWMILDSAETLFLTSETRVLDIVSKKPLEKIEENPKWLTLSDILEDIREEIRQNKSKESEEKILVLTSDHKTAQQLEEYLEIGAQKLLLKILDKSPLAEKYGGGTETKKKEVKHKGRGKRSHLPNPGEEKEKEKEEPKKSVFIKSMQIGNFEKYKLLKELKPRYVIMYDIDMATIRQLEVFQASIIDELRIKVYFVMYGKSAEEQAYLTTLRREMEAFHFLAKERDNMVIPEDRDGKNETNPDLSRDPSKASDAISSALMSKRKRANEEKSSNNNKRIIVDMREFRCELPSLIHKRGIDIEPVTLEVGDYILTPEICVERKSISDLIGSLNGGRLFSQATSMTRFYEKPMLLIEFDSNKPFSLQHYVTSKDSRNAEVVNKLILLTMHFPKLRILWSPSPYATAELFEELKQGREEPDPGVAVKLCIDNFDDLEGSVEKYNPAIFDFMEKLPGINPKNIYSVLNRFEDLGEVLRASVEELTEVLESGENAKLLYDALHKKIDPCTLITEERDKKPSAAAPAAPRFKTKLSSKKITKM